MPIRKKRKRIESWACFGFDVSVSSISGAAIGYTPTLARCTGPVFSSHRFTKDVHYYDRLKFAVSGGAGVWVWDLCAQLKLPSIEPSRIYIAVEEPFPFGMVGNRAGKFQSAWIKQQSQIQGAFLAGLIRNGYTNVFEINNTQWRKVIADAMGITTHHTKWDKWKPKEWALENFNGIPDMPDLINHSKLGLIPRPEGSRAKAVQPEDIYDALGMAMWMRQEVGFQWTYLPSAPSSIKSEQRKKVRKRSMTSAGRKPKKSTVA